MPIATHDALIVAALLGGLVLAMQRGDRLFPVIALVVAGVEALIAFDLLRISISKLRLDLILPGLLAVAGAASWSRVSTRSAVTAATVVTLVGLLQLLGALDVLS